MTHRFVITLHEKKSARPMPSSATIPRLSGIDSPSTPAPLQPRPLRVGFVSHCERNDRNFYSEIPFQLAGAFERLQSEGMIEFSYLGPISDDARQLRRLRLRQRLENRITGKLTRPEMFPPITRQYVRRVEDMISGRQFDLLVGNWAWNAMLSKHAPVVLFRDATIGLLDDYDYFNSLSKLSRNWAEELERKAAKNCLIQFFTSQWAVDSAVTKYGSAPKDAAILPFGVNFKNLPSRFEVLRQISSRNNETCRLLFIGREWERKGGDFAVDIVNQLNELGVKAVIEIVGTDVPASVQSNPHVRLHGFLSKDVREDLDKLTRLMMDSHYLLVPSRAECFGIVYAEASAFGLPSIARDVGGVSGAVSKRNGFLLPSETRAREAACQISENFVDGPKYIQLARSARQEYEQRFNWDSVARELLRVSAARLDESGQPVPANASESRQNHGALARA